MTLATRIAATASLMVLLFASLASGQEAEGDRVLPEWIDRVQTYAMVPVLPETAARMHVSVNGLWGGVDSDHVILPSGDMMLSVRKKYGDDVGAFARDCRDAGLIVCSMVNGIEGMKGLRERYPHLDDMACRRADGSLATNGEWPLMCVNNSDWLAAEVELGRAAIDHGAELLLIDTPMSSAFLSTGFLKAGHCKHCTANFERYLNEHYTPQQLRDKLGIERFEASAITDRLIPYQDFDQKKRPFADDEPDDRLFREFVLCQERASFETRKHLAEALRKYAQEEGKPLALATNAADLSTMGAFGHWIRGLMFADMVDFFGYEQRVMPLGLPPQEPMPLPRGSWAAYHKLAHAIHGRRSPALLHADEMGKFLIDAVVLKRRTANAWFGALAAEAYAANGAFVLFHVEAPRGNTSGLDKLWATASDVNEFVLAHRDWYEGEQRSGSPLAMVFLMNERGRTIPAVFPSYLGLSLALVEGNYPFDVLFGGDGHYVKDRLDLKSLHRYRAIVVPSPIDPTDNQKRVIEQFVREGGTLVVQEPERLGLDVEWADDQGRDVADVPCIARAGVLGKGHVLQLAGEVTPTSTGDVGSQFFRTYDADARKQIHGLADALGLTPVLAKECNALVGAFSVVQPDHRRVVVHLVNYDIDRDADTAREKADIVIALPRSLLPEGTLEAEVHVPGKAEALPVAVKSTAESTTCTVPSLKTAATVVITAR